MNIINQCIIAGCPNEAKIVAKSGKRIYFACDWHKKDALQIVATENKINNFISKSKNPEWMKKDVQ